MAEQIQVPSQFMLQKPPSLPGGMKTETIRLNPLNQLSSTTGTIISFQLPQLSGAFLDPQSMYFSMQVTFTGTCNTYSSPTYSTGSFILGTSAGLSMFQRYSLYFAGSQQLEDIFQPGVLVHMLSRSVASSSELQGMSPSGVGSEIVAYASNGLVSIPNTCFQLGAPDAGIPTGATTTWSQQVNFTFQVPGILGVSQEKMVPLSLGNFRTDFTVDALSNFCADIASSTFSTTGFTINAMELVTNLVYPPSGALQEIYAAQPVMFLKNTSYSLVTGTLAAEMGASQVQIPLSSARASLRNITMTTWHSAMPEGKFGSINPNMVAGSGLVLNGKLTPQNGVDPSNKPASVFMDLQAAWGSQASVNYNGCLFKTAYYRSSTNSGLMKAANTTAGSILTAPSTFLLDLSTEKFSRRGYLLAGSELQTSSFMQITTGTALANYVHNVYLWLTYDLVLQLDLQQGTITRYA